MACYVVNTSAEDPQSRKKCGPILEDYYECLHHKKEVRSRTDLGETWGRIGYASWTIVWMDLADRRLLPPRTARAHPSSPAGLPQGGEGKPQRRPADRGADTESWVNRQGGGHCKSAADVMSIKSKGWWKESRMGWGSGGERRKRRRAIRPVFCSDEQREGFGITYGMHWALSVKQFARLCWVMPLCRRIRPEASWVGRHASGEMRLQLCECPKGRNLKTRLQ